MKYKGEDKVKKYLIYLFLSLFMIQQNPLVSNPFIYDVNAINTLTINAYENIDWNDDKSL